ELDRLRVDLEVLGGVLVRDVAGGHRAIESALFARVRDDRARDLLELLRERLELHLRLALLRDEAALDALEAVEVVLRHLDREALGQEVIAAVAVRDVDDIADLAELLDVSLKEDFHGSGDSRMGKRGN